MTRGCFHIGPYIKLERRYQPQRRADINVQA